MGSSSEDGIGASKKKIHFVECRYAAGLPVGVLRREGKTPLYINFTNLVTTIKIAFR
jgi:hypothetical protein